MCMIWGLYVNASYWPNWVEIIAYRSAMHANWSKEVGRNWKLGVLVFCRLGLNESSVFDEP